MMVTNVKLKKFDAERKVKAVVSVTLDNAFVVHDIKVVESPKGLIVTMPSRKIRSGGYRDIAHPISQEAREMISKAVLDTFERAQIEGASTL
ncbi:septation regulator SpoVG [Heliobacillus mobilis]|uniref:Septation regulator SpoVG n=1 Tax=Heliobacterium mobile TaxID=28064 RepID=A0A6I3SJL0_HELMO|nr:septation regulator SpoVG [Heliobacterium mobile]MTV49088.1 septation regulator SpoVG [Heliobacterium mobile]